MPNQTTTQWLYLLLALRFIMDRHQRTPDEIASASGVPPSAIENIFKTRTRKLDPAPLLDYIKNFPFEYDHDIAFVMSRLFVDKTINSEHFTNALYPLAIRSFLKLDQSHAIPNFSEYAGLYLVHRQSFDPKKITSILLEIVDSSKTIAFPTYRLLQRISSRVERQGIGFVITSRTHLTCVGHRGDADIEMAILNRIEPPIDFLTGIALTTTRDKQAFAANLFCDRISPNVGTQRELHDEFVGIRDVDSFKSMLSKMGKSDDNIKRIMFQIENRIAAKNPEDPLVLCSRRPNMARDYDSFG